MKTTRFKTPCLTLLTVLILGAKCLTAAEVKLVEEPVVTHRQLEDGNILLDFGKVSFGNLKIKIPHGLSSELKFHFGEAMKEGRIDRKPPGSVRYRVAELNGAELKPGWQVVAPPPIGWNSRPHVTVRPPEAFGVLTPFRWVEIEGWQGPTDPASILRRTSYLEAWDDGAADFECSDVVLNKIWDLCKYSIKATTFAGIYVDGDRERIPYEADAYLNQLSHYYTDADKQIARDTYDWLMAKPTWPTEWASHMLFMAHADWRYTGDVEWIRAHYTGFKTKLLMHRVGPEGWVRSDDKARSKVRGYHGQRDIVDWPGGERDGYVFTEVNTVINAFHLKTLEMIADFAGAIGRQNEEEDYRKQYEYGLKRFHKALWVEDQGCYRDGIGTDHTSAHATFFPLAFGMVPEDCRGRAVNSLKSKDMVCSVYAAQYLMEALFENGAGDYAIQLIKAEGDRSWKHMVESGTTITWEAWDQKYKGNQDWNHAWGAAPANLLPRYVLGVEPTKPGWTRFRIKPHPGNLSKASGKVPTPHGPVLVDWQRNGDNFTLNCSIPAGATADALLPSIANNNTLSHNGKRISVQRVNDRVLISGLPSGVHRIEFTQ